MHFDKPDLSITVISDHIGISVSYLSRVYMKYRGIGLLDYIHKVRLERAKELLESNKNIKDIALQVGYLESKALIRSFKRYEGITPGRYKETLVNRSDTAKDHNSPV
jgi:AraC-like DNA-binding protein